MSQPVRSWIALGVLACVGTASVRPAIAQTAPSAPAATAPAANGAPAAQPVQPVPQAQPYPPPGYPPPGYPPPGYAAPGYPPGYGGYPPPYAAYPPGYQQPTLTTVHRPRRGLVTGGAITFGVSWGIAATISLLANDSCSEGCSDNADYLWVPVAGPILLMSNENGSGGEMFFILWSAAQAAGLIMFVVGMVGHDVQEYRIAKGGPALSLQPMVARNSGGMGLTARW